MSAEPKEDPPAPATTDTPLDAVNEQFHAAHEAARNQARHDAPVLVVLADELIVFEGGSRSAYSFSPPLFHILKSAAHAPVALFALCEREPRERSNALSALHTQICRSLVRLSAEELQLEPAVYDDMRAVLERTRDLAQTLQAGAPREGVDAFAAAVGPGLLRLAHAATRVQLASLHAHTSQVLSTLSPAQRRTLHVVVAGDHQARVRSLPMQYFKKLLDEPAAEELRVTYAEGVRDERAAFELVGAQRLDRCMARAFFGEEKRLQRDILGDAAAVELESLDLHDALCTSARATGPAPEPCA
ncbi:MAG TPA: hypothetical protein VFZ61_18010 [Polyangiales bacterium]